MTFGLKCKRGQQASVSFTIAIALLLALVGCTGDSDVVPATPGKQMPGVPVPAQGDLPSNTPAPALSATAASVSQPADIAASATDAPAPPAAPPLPECPAPVGGFDRETSAATDRAALEAFYHATRGPRWDTTRNWLTDLPLDEWHGVTTNDKGRVTELRLPENHLAGSLPAELGSLSALTVLDVDGNSTGGSIPPELGNLSNLTSLDIGFNVSGTIPPRLCNLSRLNHLSLYGYLDGPVPPELANLSSLESLFLQFGNDFIGELPPELGNLSNLKHLRVGGNRARLTGSIPPELGNLSQLESLYLWSNSLTGRIPPELGNLSNLQTLMLGGNQLTGVIPPELGNLSSLSYLDLEGNRLTGPIPAELGNLSRLLSLGLNQNRLTGAIPPELGNLPNLVSLGLESNELTGPIPRELGNLGLLSDRQLNVRLPEEVPDPFELEESLNEEFMQTGVMPPELALLWLSLSSLDLSNNNLTGEIPPELGNLVNLSGWLNLGHNNLTGPVPPELSNLSNLAYLLLGGNDLTGELPASVLGLTNLSQLRIEDNAGLCAPVYLLEDRPRNLEGPGCRVKADGSEIVMYPPDREVLEAFYHATGGPQWDRNLNWLTDLPPWQWEGVIVNDQGRVYGVGVTGNNLTGTIPPDLAKLSELAILDLRYNGLTGEIPQELGRLSNLHSLDISHNKLSGPIPHELGDAPGMAYVRLEGNRLVGELPQSFSNFTQLEQLKFDDNDGLCAPPALLENLRAIGHVFGPECGAPVFTAETDRDALVAFYHATGGPNWWDSTNWLSDLPLNQWHGVATNENGRVIFLRLRENNLSGPLARELANLTYLSELDLDENHLTGAVPPELAQLANLNTLRLWGNQLTGEIPEDFSRLRGMWLVLFGENGGLCLPPSLQGWLEGIQLSTQGAIQEGWGPACASSSPVGDADRAALVALYNATGGPEWVNNKNWSTDAPIWGWHGVTTDSNGRVTGLQLESNRLIGVIPPELGSLTELAHLELGENHLTGDIPPELGKLSSLVTLSLRQNALTGPIPHEMGNFAMLRSLDLFSNWLMGEFPPELGNLGNLYRLELADNDLRGELPAGLARFEQLNELYFNDNGGLCAPPSLQDWMEAIEANGPICAPPSAAADADRAVLVALYHANGGTEWWDSRNWLTDIPMRGWSGVETDSSGRVSRLDLGGNNLSGAILPELGNLSNLTYLDLVHNDLTGPIPPELGSLANLTVLRLGGNKLTGALPAELGNLTGLNDLDVSDNRLKGEMPSSLANLTKVDFLRFRDNYGLCAPLSLRDWYWNIDPSAGPACRRK